MLYVDFKAGDNDYKLRLATRNIVALEKALGGNPLSIFGNGESIPSITAMTNILFCSLQQYQHGITYEKACDIFDDYLTENSMTDFITVILDIYKVSGIMKDSTKDENEKNAVAGK